MIKMKPLVNEKFKLREETTNPVYLVRGDSESGDHYHEIFKSEPTKEQLSKLAHSWDGDAEKTGPGYDGSYVHLKVTKQKINESKAIKKLNLKESIDPEEVARLLEDAGEAIDKAKSLFGKMEGYHYNVRNYIENARSNIDAAISSLGY